MLKYFKSEYILLLFLLVNVTAEYIILAPISKIFFYAVLALSVPVCIVNISSINRGFRSCPYILIWIIIYIVYQITTGAKYATSENLIYLVAKVATYCIMLLCINKNLCFYLYKLSKPMGYVIALLLLVGFNILSPRGDRSFGFFNGNAGCAIAMIGTACFLFSEEKHNTWGKLCLFICAGCVVLGSSRNSIAMLAILLIMRYGLSPKMILGGIILLIGVVFVLPEVGVELPSVNRMLGTFEGNVAIDREAERKAALWMIAQHPWDGNGFNFTNYGDALELTEYGAHNGYLEILEQMGYCYGGAWLLVLAIGVLNNLRLYKDSDIHVKKYLAIMLAILFGANQECYLSGVNQFTTNMLYVSMVVLWVYNYNKINRVHIK